MNLRRALSTGLTALAVLAVGLGTAAPAGAATATTCNRISVSASADSATVFTSDGTSAHGIAITGISGRTTAICSGSSYKYKVTFSSYATGDISTSSSSVFGMRGGGTAVAFPSVSFPTPNGSGLMQVRVQSYYKSGGYFWVTSSDNDQVFFINVPGDFDSATGAGTSTTASCTSTAGGPPKTGFGAWC